MTNAQTQPESMDTIIGENVNFLMFRSRMNQVELATRIGMTQGALSRKLRGDRPWYADEIAAAAHTFSISVGRLFVKLPDLDSNQEPTHSTFAPEIIDLSAERAHREERHRKLEAHGSSDAEVRYIDFTKAKASGA